MKAKQHSFKRNPITIPFLFVLIICGLTKVNAQCPTVTNNAQSFCDLQSVLVGDLQATDNGGGIVWYESATSTIPLSNSDGLISGEDYYADDNTGICGPRARVDVTIYGPPTGNNFQGFCISGSSLATVSDLIATGNDVQWYLSPSGGIPLNGSDILIDNTIYYADQASPDGSCRTSRLSVFVNVGITSFPTGDMVQSFCGSSTSNPTVGDLVASGTNNWYISLFSALPLPASTPLVNGQTYYATTVDPPCESSGRLAVLVILEDGPDSGSDGILDICSSNTSSTFNLFNSLEGSPETSGTWTPALSSGTGIYNPSIDPQGVYIYTVTSTNTCPDTSSTVTVSIIPEPNAGTDVSINLCSNNSVVDLFSSLGGTPETGGIWSPTLNSGTGVFNPALDSDGIYTYTVSGTAPCSNATATVNVSVTLFQDAGENGTIDICNNIGIIDLFNSLEGTPSFGGVWSPALNSGSGVFDPLVDTAGVYTYSFTGNAPCSDESATVTVAVVPLPIAGSDTTLEICSNDLATVNLFDNLGGLPESGGTWSPALASGTGIFDPSVDTAGIYTYTLIGTPPCTDVSAEISVSIIQEPDAGMNATVNLCSNNGTIDLFDSLEGTPEVGGTWTPTLNSGTNVFDPLIDAVGTYTYTVTGTNPCADATATITISVSTFQNAGTDGSVTVCTADGTINLFDSLGGTPDVGGTWSPTLTSGTGVFDPTIDTAGTYTYTTSSSGSCANDSATVEVSVEISPNAGTDGTLDLCDLTSSADLINSLNGTPQAGGTWSPALTSGTGIFDPNSDTEGVYTYTINSVICGNSSATVTVSVIDANDAGNNGVVELCFNDTAIDLFNSLGGTPDTGGTWSPALTSGTGVFDPTIDAAGIYTYTVSNSATLCPDDSATITATVLQGPDAGNDGTLNLCDSTNIIDLFSGLAGTPEIGGTWSPALSSGTGIFDPNTDAEGTYTYTLNNSCGTSSATVTISLSNTNDAGTNGTIELCNTDATVDLFNSLGGTPDVGGIWTPTLTSGTGMFDPTFDTSGIYTYTVSNASSTCPDATATVTVSVLQGPNAGNNGTLNLCDSTNTIDLFNSLAGTPEAGGTWSPALTSGTGIFDPNTDPEGTYTYTLNNSCGTNSATVTVSLSNVNDAGTNGTIELCSTDATVDLFSSLGGTPDVGGIWSPTLTGGTGVFNPMVDTAGVYTYTVSNTVTSCPDASATVTVSVLQGPNAGNNGMLNLCNSTASVDLFNSLAGTPEAGGTWSPAMTSGTGVFDPNTDPEGTYTYTLNNSCGTNSATVTVSLSNVNDAGTNGTIELCSTDATVDLFSSLGGTPDIGGVWSPALNSGTGMFNPTIDTANTYTYTVSSTGSTCPDATANVIVTLTQVTDAGSDGTLDLCSNDTNSVDLFNSLNGTPDTGGVWSPALTSGTGMFDPTTDAAGVYTYTVTNSCGNNTAEVTVSISSPNDAGTDGAIELCSNDTSVDLFDSLDGTPETGGVWVPILTSGTGIFDPMVDTAGTYTYLVSDTTGACPDATAVVEVTILALPDAGINNTLNLCADDTDSVDLFDNLDGTPETGGAWTPTLTSGTGVFDPTVDTAGVYTYSVTSTECNITITANVTVTVLNLPDISGLIMFMDDNLVCIGLEDAVVNITGANQLPDGDYSIVYQLTEANTSVNTAAISITGGDATFTIPLTLLQNPGVTMVALTQLFVLGQTCSAITNAILPIKIVVEDLPTPEIIENGTEFCLEDISTITDLSNNVSNINIENEMVVWYDQPADGVAYTNSETLQEGVVYYGALRSQFGCESNVRLEVTISYISCIGSLKIPDGFSPNDDGINDTFDILFIKDLHPNFKVSIYNRYGNILYQGDKDSPLWDGTWKNNNTVLPVGVYFYIIEFNDGETEAIQGRVYLSR